MNYDGYNGTMRLDGDALVITRTGMVARAAFGKDTAPRSIPLKAIGGVHFKPASRLSNGWLQLVVGSDAAAELTTTQAASDADTVLFTNKNREQFEQLHGWLQTVVAKNRADGVDPSAYGVEAGGAAGRFDRMAAKTADGEGAVTGRLGALAEKAQRVAEKATEAAEQARAKSAAAADSARAAATERAQTTGILFEGISHDPGRNAKVTLYTDRLERVQEAKLTSLSRAKQDVEVTPVRAISSVQAKKDGMLYTKVTAFASGNNIDFRFGHDEAQRFKDVLMQLVLQGPAAPPAAPAAAAQPDVMDQLKKLGELRDAGVLTDEEFTAKKADLLDRL